MSRYVDAVVLPVPTDELETYTRIATEAGAVWMEHGALEYFEGVEDDRSDEGEGTSMQSFSEIVGTAPDESNVIAFIGFESREHRDEVQAAVHEDPAYQTLFEDGMPFDPARMTTGSFRPIVSFTD